MKKKALNNMHPFVSIIVLNWNGMDYLEKCLQSLMCLTYPNYEVIVVDNGSSDGSPDMVKRSFPNVKLITNKSNLGFAKGNNVGIKASRGDLIVLFNNDVVADSSWLFELVKTAISSHNIGVASGIILQGKPSDIIWSAGIKIDAFTGNDWRIGYGKKLNQLEKVEDLDYFSACALLIRRDVVEKIGLLDEGYFFYGEDADWAFCARRAGYKCKLAPSAIVWHEGSMTSKRTPIKRYYWYNLSNFRLYLKHFPVKYLFTTLFFQLVFLSFFEVFFFKRPIAYLLLKLKAFVWNMVNLPKTMAERKKIERFGELKLKRRLREILKVAKVFTASKYYEF